MSLRMVLLSRSVHAISWPESTVLLKRSLRIFNTNEAIGPISINSSGALTLLKVLVLGPVQFIPCSKVAFLIEILLDLCLRARLPDSRECCPTVRHVSHSCHTVLKEALLTMHLRVGKEECADNGDRRFHF